MQNSIANLKVEIDIDRAFISTYQSEVMDKVCIAYLVAQIVGDKPFISNYLKGKTKDKSWKQIIKKFLLSVCFEIQEKEKEF